MSTISGPAYRIHTPRLVVRCLEPADAPLFKEAIDASIEHLRPWIPWALDEPTSLDDKVATLRTFRGKFDLGQDFLYGIFDRDETRVLGGTGLHTRIGPIAREIGYWVRPDALRQGYVTESTAALVRVGFEIEKLRRIEIHCDSRNTRSAAIPAKLGFTLEATLRKRTFDSEKVLRDSMIWSLLDEEYPTSPSAQVPIKAYDAAGRLIL